MELAERLENYLKKKNIRVAEFSRRTGVRANQFSDLFRGRLKSLGFEQLEKIVRNCDISPDYLFSGRGPVLRQQVNEQSPAEAKARIIIEDLLENNNYLWVRRELKEKAIAILAEGISSEKKSLAEWGAEAKRLFDMAKGD